MTVQALRSSSSRAFQGSSSSSKAPLKSSLLLIGKACCRCLVPHPLRRACWLLMVNRCTSWREATVRSILQAEAQH